MQQNRGSTKAKRRKAYLHFAMRALPCDVKCLADLNSYLSRAGWNGITSRAAPSALRNCLGKDSASKPLRLQRGSDLYLFDARAYNNSPQQSGRGAQARAAYTWSAFRSSRSWAAEHPTAGLLRIRPPRRAEHHGKTYLSFQGNDDYGRSYWISMVRIFVAHARDRRTLSRSWKRIFMSGRVWLLESKKSAMGWSCLCRSSRVL